MRWYHRLLDGLIPGANLWRGRVERETVAVHAADRGLVISARYPPRNNKPLRVDGPWRRINVLVDDELAAQWTPYRREPVWLADVGDVVEVVARSDPDGVELLRRSIEIDNEGPTIVRVWPTMSGEVHRGAPLGGPGHLEVVRPGDH